MQQGLNEYEWRWEAKNFLSKRRDFCQPVWDGKGSINGKTILVWGEQGPQDMIIWSTALEYLDKLAEHCILECPEKLVPLFARSLPNLTVKAENRAFDETDKILIIIFLWEASLKNFTPRFQRE